MRTRAKVQQPKIDSVCPLCEKAFPRAGFETRLKAEPLIVRRRIINAIRQEYPVWTMESGACSKCWNSFRDVIRVQLFVRKLKTAKQGAGGGKQLSADLRVFPLYGLVGLLFVLTGCGRQSVHEPQKLAVQTVIAESTERLRAGAEASYIAVVHAENETDLSFKVGGIVDIIGPGSGTNWNEGTPVKAGDLLAGLKQSDFTNALKSSRAEAELTTKLVERFRKLRERDAISQQELDVTEARFLTTRAQLDQAEQNLRDSQLRAPIDGVVLARYVNPGVTVGAGQRVLRFADFSTMSVELGVPDRLVNYFSPGKKLDVEISALEGHVPFPGTVTEVGVAASQEGRLFRVVIKVANPKGIIRSGMTATVRVGELARFSPGSVQVPLSALITQPSSGKGSAADPPQLAVFVVSAKKVSRRPVKTGDIIHSSIVVTDGLKAGEEVVTAGASFLYDGAPVEVLPTQPTRE